MSVTYLNTTKCTYNKKVLNINKYFEIYNKNFENIYYRN